MSLSQRNLKGVSIDLIKVKLFKPKWKHDGIQNITNAPTLTYIVYTIRDEICQNLSF